MCQERPGYLYVSSGLVIVVFDGFRDYCETLLVVKLIQDVML